MFGFTELYAGTDPFNTKEIEEQDLFMLGTEKQGPYAD